MWHPRAHFDAAVAAAPELEAFWEADLSHAFCVSRRQSEKVARMVAALAGAAARGGGSGSGSGANGGGVEAAPCAAAAVCGGSGGGGGGGGGGGVVAKAGSPQRVYSRL